MRSCRYWKGSGSRLSPGSASRGGLTVFLTGFSGAGKSTLALALRDRLLRQRSYVQVLDGDMFRTLLSPAGEYPRRFHKQIILRAITVAEEITRAGGIAICAAIAGNQDIRAAREAIERWGVFVAVHISTPLAVCEERDPHSVYRLAREGVLEGLTGLTDPYQAPESPDLEIDTSTVPVPDAVELIVSYLRGG